MSYLTFALITAWVYMWLREFERSVFEYMQTTYRHSFTRWVRASCIPFDVYSFLWLCLFTFVFLIYSFFWPVTFFYRLFVSGKRREDF